MPRKDLQKRIRLCLGGGSDSDITPLDALLGIHAAVNQPYPENSVTPYEAVRMYTSDGARCGWEDDVKGKLVYNNGLRE